MPLVLQLSIIVLISRLFRPNLPHKEGSIIFVRFEVFMAVTEEWCLLGCYAAWLL
jgi:hypothetical protein